MAARMVALRCRLLAALGAALAAAAPVRAAPGAEPWEQELLARMSERQRCAAALGRLDGRESLGLVYRLQRELIGDSPAGARATQVLVRVERVLAAVLEESLDQQPGGSGLGCPPLSRPGSSCATAAATRAELADWSDDTWRLAEQLVTLRSAGRIDCLELDALLALAAEPLLEPAGPRPGEAPADPGAQAAALAAATLQRLEARPPSREGSGEADLRGALVADLLESLRAPVRERLQRRSSNCLAQAFTAFELLLRTRRTLGDPHAPARSACGLPGTVEWRPEDLARLAPALRIVASRFGAARLAGGPGSIR